MTEADIMDKELSEWIAFLAKLRKCAIEMQSHEKDDTFISETVFSQPEADYLLTFTSRSGMRGILRLEWTFDNGEVDL